MIIATFQHGLQATLFTMLFIVNCNILYRCRIKLVLAHSVYATAIGT